MDGLVLLRVVRCPRAVEADVGLPGGLRTLYKLMVRAIEYRIND